MLLFLLVSPLLKGILTSETPNNVSHIIFRKINAFRNVHITIHTSISINFFGMEQRSCATSTVSQPVILLRPPRFMLQASNHLSVLRWLCRHEALRWSPIMLFTFLQLSNFRLHRSRMQRLHESPLCVRVLLSVVPEEDIKKWLSTNDSGKKWGRVEGAKPFSIHRTQG